MIRFLQSGNKAAKYILGGFLILLAMSMVAYLIPGFMTSADVTGRSGVLATVAGESIRTEDATKLAQAQLRRQRLPEAMVPFLMQQVVQRLIQTQEVRYEAGRMGLKVSNQEVRDELQNGVYKQYFFPDGKWIGQEQYEKFLTENGLTVEGFEADVKDGLLANKLFNTVLAGVQASPAEVQDAYKQQNTKVKFQYAVLNLADIQKEIQPTETELKAFYETNKHRYENSIPEKRQIRYFVLNDKDVANQVTVDATDLQRYYSANADRFRTPERVRSRHILIKTPPPGADGKPDQKGVDEARAKAADVLKQVKSGGDFAALAKKYSQDPGSADKGGELPWATRGNFVPEFEKVAFSQSPGQISDLVQTSYGFHIIQTEEKEPARVKPLSEVKDEITPIVRAEKAGVVLDKALASAEATAKKQGLEKAAAQSGAPVVTSNPVAHGDVLPGIGPAPDLMNVVFATSEKDGPQVGRYPQGYVIFEIARIVPASTPSFDQVKEQLTGEFKNQRAGELLRKRAQELADRARNLHDLAKAAKETGATLKASDLVARSGQVPDLGGMSGPLSAAFTLKPGEISGPLNLGMKSAVLQVTDRQEPSLTDPQFAQARDGLQEQLSQQKRQQALELFMSNLDSRMEKEGKIKRNKAEINNLTRSRS